MPPRTVKRGAGPRRTSRVTRGSQKAQNHQPPDVPEDPMTVEGVPIPATEAKEDVKVEAEPTMEEKPPAIEEKPVVVNQLISDLNEEAKAEPNGLESKFLCFDFEILIIRYILVWNFFFFQLLLDYWNSFLTYCLLLLCLFWLFITLFLHFWDSCGKKILPL